MKLRVSFDLKHILNHFDFFNFFFSPRSEFPYDLLPSGSRVQLPVLQTACIPSSGAHSRSPTAWPRTRVSHGAVSKGRWMAGSRSTLQKPGQDLTVLIPKRTVSHCADFFLTWIDVPPSDHGTLGYDTSWAWLGSLGCGGEQSLAPAPVRQCLAPTCFRETQFWCRTIRVVLSVAEVKNPSISKLLKVSFC